MNIPLDTKLKELADEYRFLINHLLTWKKWDVSID